MKAEDLDLSLLLGSSNTPGKILTGRHARALLFESAAAYRLADELEATLGEDRAQGVLARFGYQSGYGEATRLRELLDWDSEFEWVRASARALTLNGVADARYVSLEVDRAQQVVRAEVEALDSFEAEERKQFLGTSERPQCHRLAGYLTGYVSACLGRSVFFVEVCCAAERDDARRCSFQGLSAGAWGARSAQLRKLYERDSVAAQLEANEQRLLEQSVRLREQEAELATRRELAEASRLKSEFLANVSHELRTPLHSILGYVALLSTRVGPKLPPRHRSNLQRVQENAEHLLHLINSILDLSKIEAGELELSVERLDPRPLLKALLDDTRILLRDKPVEVVEGPGIAELPPLRVDPVRLKQCLTNLLGNAVKFTTQGTITLDAQRLPQEAPGNPELVALRVRDTGPGIPAVEQQRIFEPFRQQDGSASRAHDGTGLGLSIVRQLLSSMGGEVRLESAEGAGSTFSLVLPVAGAERQAPEPAPQDAPPTPHDPPALLVISLDPDFRRHAQTWLSSGDLPPVQIELAARHDEGVASARRTSFGAIVLDLRRAEEVGLAALRLIKEDPRTQQVPLVAVHDSLDSTPAFRAGADVVLDSCDRGRLLVALHQVLNGAAVRTRTFPRPRPLPSFVHVDTISRRGGTA